MLPIHSVLRKINFFLHSGANYVIFCTILALFELKTRFSA